MNLYWIRTKTYYFKEKKIPQIADKISLLEFMQIHNQFNKIE